MSRSLRSGWLYNRHMAQGGSPHPGQPHSLRQEIGVMDINTDPGSGRPMDPDMVRPFAFYYQMIFKNILTLRSKEATDMSKLMIGVFYRNLANIHKPFYWAMAVGRKTKEITLGIHFWKDFPFYFLIFFFSLEISRHLSMTQNSRKYFLKVPSHLNTAALWIKFAAPWFFGKHSRKPIS